MEWESSSHKLHCVREEIVFVFIFVILSVTPCVSLTSLQGID